MSTLYIVATPIGNLSDISQRALATLEMVDVVAAEDTRHTGALLSHFGMKKRLVSCHQQNEMASSQGIIKLLDEGMNVAFCSDAGTPGVSDPGARLVEEVRNNTGHDIVPIPGPSAFVTLLSVAAMSLKAFFLKRAGRGERGLKHSLHYPCRFSSMSPHTGWSNAFPI